MMSVTTGSNILSRELVAQESQWSEFSAYPLIETFPQIFKASLKPTLTFTLPDEGAISRIIALHTCHVSEYPWSRLTDREAASCFELAVQTKTPKEADAIKTLLVQNSGLLISESDPEADFKEHVQCRQFTHFGASENGNLELHVRPNFKSTSGSACLQLLASLLRDFQFTASAESIFETRQYDFNRAAERRAWANDSFQDWYLSLSAAEICSLKELGTAKYHEINQRLRQSDPTAQRQVGFLENVLNIDRAIARGQLQLDLKLYRAVGKPFDQIAERLSRQAAVVRVHDPAFMFFSLHQEVAEKWNRGLDRGVILEISAPRGTPAAFLQVPGIFPERDHDEVVLARDTELVLSGLKFNHSGVPVISGRIQPRIK